MHTHISLIFNFYYFFILGWAGLGPAQHTFYFWAGPGHWPKPVARLGCVKVHAWSEFTRALNCAKVIKLPSHSVLATLNLNEERKWRGTAYLLLETEKKLAERWCLSPLSFCFPFCSCAHDLLSSSSRFEMMKESTMKTLVYCGCQLLILLLFFLLQGLNNGRDNPCLCVCCPFSSLLFTCCSVFFFFVLSFSGFFSLVFWVGSSSLFFSLCIISFSGFLLWFCFLFRSLILGFLLPFIEIPQSLPLTSPAFAGLLFSTNEIVGERRDPRLDRIRCRFSACWIGMEKTNTAVPPATATFRQQWTFSFWPLIFGILTVGSQLIKNSFQFCHLD